MDIPIVLTLNSAYTKQATVVMYTALQNANSQTRYSFYLISNDLKSDDVLYMHQHLDKFEQMSQLVVVYMDSGDWQSIPSIGRFGKETNFRLFVPTLLPALSKFLYLDCDVMVLDDLTSLYQTDISGKAYAACSEKKLYQMRWNPLVHARAQNRFVFFCKFEFDILDDTTHYINAGVMLINNDYWKQHNWQQRALQFLNQNKDDPNFAYPDQDALNILAWQDGQDSRVYLDWRYNVSNAKLLQPPKQDDILQRAVFGLYGYDGDRYREFRPAIIHYAGQTQPWHGGKLLMAKQYRRYAKEVAWYPKYRVRNLVAKIMRFSKTAIQVFVPHGIVLFFVKHETKSRAVIKKILPNPLVKLLRRVF